MYTWKTSSGTLCHIVASGSAAAGQFTLDVLEICCVLSPECEEGHTWDPCLAPFGEPQLPTHLNTYPRSTCNYCWHSGAAGVIPPSERLFLGPGFSCTTVLLGEVPPTYIFGRFWFVYSMYTWKTSSGTLCHFVAS